MKTRTVLAAAATALMLTLTACGGGGSSSGSGEPQAGGDLVIARADETQSLLPTGPFDNASIWTMEEIYDTLLVPTSDGKGVEASLATSWKQSADKLSWTFKLRKGVEFSNGKPLTSADVKFSLEQGMKPDANVSFINQVIKSIATPDDDTVVITTKQPWAPLPADLAMFGNSIVPKDYGGKTAAEFDKKPIGTGPFMLSSWVKGESIKLVKNPHYWQSGKPYLDSVTFTVVADANTRATQVQSGQADVDEFPAYSSLSALDAGSTKVGTFESSRVDYFIMNTKRKPFDDRNVRLAIAQAIDRDALIKTVQFGHGEAAKGYMSPALWAYDDSIEPPAYDLDTAKATLAKSSVPNGFTTTLTVGSGDADEIAAAQLIQASLKKLGITVKLQTLDPSAVSDAKHAGNYDMGFTYQTTDIVDPDEIIRFAGLDNGGSNTLYTFYKDAELEKLADKADTLSDQAARKKIYSQIQEAINEATPYVALYYSPSVYAYSAKVHDFHPYPTGNYNLVDTWVEH